MKSYFREGGREGGVSQKMILDYVEGGGLKPLKKEFFNGPLHMANSVEGGRNV